MDDRQKVAMRTATHEHGGGWGVYPPPQKKRITFRVPPPLETSYLLPPPLKRILAVTNHKKVGKISLKVIFFLTTFRKKNGIVFS